MSGHAPLQDPFGLVGSLVDRKYRVDRLVAQGGFGVVYFGRHLSLDAPVAIKVLRLGRDVDDEACADLLARFLDEAKTLAKLRHPSIVGVLDAGSTHAEGLPGVVPWMVLEWLEGRTLHDELSARRGSGGRPPTECLALLRPVLEGIAYAHEAGIAHRDLKPSNVMLVPQGERISARVLDFGIAKWMEPGGTSEAPTGNTLTGSRTTAFTPAFAAPEQLSGGRTGPWTDVFALGLLLTEMLLDAPSLPAGDPTEHYRAVFAAERPSPLKARLDVGAWEQVLASALAVRPADRPANAGTLLAQLEAALPESRHQWSGRNSDAPPYRNSDGYSATKPSAREGAPVAPAPGPRWAARSWKTWVPLGGVAIVAAGLYFARGSLHTPAREASVTAPSPLAEAGSGVRANDGRKCRATACSAELGAPSICRPETGTCVALASQDCTIRAEPRDLLRDDTIWIGEMRPKTGPSATHYDRWNEHAVELARSDFAQILGGVAGARPIAVLECDDGDDARRAARHLVEDVGVPAVIGFRSGVEAMDLANTLFVPRGVLAVAATNTNPMLTALPLPAGAPRLVLRTTYSTADSATAIGRFVGEILEPQLRAEGAKPRLRVATLRARAAAGADIGDALRDHLRFNGKSAVENGDDYLELSHDMAAPPDSPELATTAAALLAFRPDVVVYVGARGATEGIVAPVERAWGARRPRPRWVEGTELLSDTLALVGNDPDRRRRFFGITPVSETAANVRFVAHYRETFSDPVSRTAAPNSSYDAFYLLAFASYALPADQPVTGVRLAEAVARLVPPGKEIEAGMSGIFDAYGILSAGGRIDFTGATGKFDFDLARGEAPFDQSILCVGRDGEGHAAGVPSGLVYRAASGKLEGKLVCP